MDLLEAVAAEDRRTVREAIRDAASLYLALPPGARRALHALNTIGGDEQWTEIAEAAAPAIVRASFQAARKSASAAAARAYPDAWPATEEEVEIEAVRLTRTASNGAG